MSLFTDNRQELDTRATGWPNGNGNGATAGNRTNGFSANNHANGTNGAVTSHDSRPDASDFAGATPAMYAEYAGAVQRTLNRMPWDQVHHVVQALVHTWQSGGQVLLMGNGGSASTASHLACDLSKNTAQPGLPRVRAVALNDNMALMSAYANDVGFDAVFSEQLRALAQPGDLVLAISTSGNSPNVLKAIEMARKLRLTTVGLCGYGGGKLAEIVDIAVVAPNYCVEQIEDIHMMLAHVVTVGMRGALQAALLRGDALHNTAPIAAPYEFDISTISANGSNGHSAIEHSSNGNGSQTRNIGSANGSHAASYIPPAAMPGYWQNSVTPLNGHD